MIRMNPPLKDWHGKTVWLVGASTGIGAATAVQLAQGGACVYVSARDPHKLDALVALQTGLHALPLDVQDVQALHQAAAQLWHAHGQIDLILFGAAMYQAHSAKDYDLDVMQQHLRVNYGGMLNLLAAVLPHLQQSQHGHVSIMASVAGYRGLPLSLAYGPTKAALQNLAENLYLDLHPLGLGVSVVNPGFVQTPLTAHNKFHMPALITPEVAARTMIRQWAQGRFEIHFPRRFTLWLKLLHLLPPQIYLPLMGRFLPH